MPVHRWHHLQSALKLSRQGYKRRKKEEHTTATTLSPLFFVSSTISIFCLEVVRENTISVYSARIVFQVSTVSCSISSPFKTIALMGSSSVGFISAASRTDIERDVSLVFFSNGSFVTLPESDRERLWMVSYLSCEMIPTWREVYKYGPPTCNRKEAINTCLAIATAVII